MPRIRHLALAIALTLAVAGPAAAVGPGASGTHAPLYYVSLGDSLSVGEQPGADGVGRPTASSYADQLYAIARSWYPNLQLVKLGCMGETTWSMIEGGGRCVYDHGSQLAEAMAFLHAHQQFVVFVTIDIGANDFPCQDSPACLVEGFTRVGANLPRILSALREAAGPSTPIVGSTLYDPFLGYWFQGPAGRAFAEASVPVMVTTNLFLSSIYAAAGVAVADVQGAFSTTDATPLPELGGVPLNVARICQWTWICAPPPVGPNNHLNAAGYSVMAQAFAATLEPLLQI